MFDKQKNLAHDIMRNFIHVTWELDLMYADYETAYAAGKEMATKLQDIHQMGRMEAYLDVMLLRMTPVEPQEPDMLHCLAAVNATIVQPQRISNGRAFVECLRKLELSQIPACADNLLDV